MSPTRLPFIARACLALVLPRAVREVVEGDITERYDLRLRDRGAGAAWAYLLRELATPDLLSLRSSPFRVPHATPPHAEAGMIQDFRFALRALTRRPVHFLAIVGTLAVGIGATSAVFALVNGVLLRPLPYPDSDRLAMLFRTVPRFGFERSSVSYPDFLDWSTSPVLSATAAYGVADRVIRVADEVSRVRGARVTAGFFPVLRVAPAIGRTISPADDRPGAPPVVVLSHGTWTSRFGGRADILGSTIRLGNEDAMVIGVMGPGFAYPSAQTAFWMPLRGDPARLERDGNFLSVIGRLAPGVTVAQAQTEIAALAARVDAEAPGANEGMGVRVESRHEFTVRGARRLLLLFQGIVVLVLALACAGVANLMFTRAISRRREMAVRAALGASRRRLYRQALIESLVPSAVGGLSGILVAAGLVRIVQVLGTGQLPRLAEVSMDWRVLAMTTVVTLACAVVCGLLPASHAIRGSINAALGHAANAVVRSRVARRAQDGLVVVQVAIGFVLVIGSTLLATTFLRLTEVRPGFEPSGVAAGRVALPRPTLPEGLTAAQEEQAAAAFTSERDRFLDELRGRVSAIPGVTNAGLTWSLPFSGLGFSSEMRAADAPDGSSPAPAIEGSVVDAGYFQAMSIPLVDGRLFDESDRSVSEAVVVISQALATRLWGEQRAVGRRVLVGDEREPHTVVGVVGDTRQQSLSEPAVPMYYQPVSQAMWATEFFIVARREGPPASLVPEMRAALRAIDPTLPLTDIAVGDALIRETVAAPRFRAVVLVILGGFALLLAIIGLYGVVALGVAERHREIGLRRALGADGGSVIGLVVGQGLRLAATGLVIGLVLAASLARFLSALLFGVKPTDVPIYLVTALLMLVVAALASLLPARRAARVDPAECLRQA